MRHRERGEADVSEHTADGAGSNGANDVDEEHGGISRRGFIAGAAGLTGVALSGVWRGAPARAAVGGSSVGRATTTSGREYLLIDGVVVGAVTRVEGGTPVGILADDEVKDPYVHKHIGGFKYEEISFKAGLNLSPPVYDWISEFMAGKKTSHDGSIVSTDSDNNIKSRVDFTNALITEVGFPALDASSKEPVGLTVKWQPESARYRVATGKVTPPSGTSGKAWLPGNFRLSIDPLDCTRVSRIDAYPVKWNPLGKIEVGPLRFTLADSSSRTWRTHMDSFVVRNSGKELTGKLEVLNLALDKTLATVDFGHMGIYRLEPDRPSPTGDGLKRLQAEFYCEEIAFTYQKVI
jgi:hypothetical protein